MADGKSADRNLALMRMSERTARDRSLSELLGALFGGPAEVPFIPLRNAERLPDALTGTDLDVTIRPGRSIEEVVRLVVGTGRRLGWMPFAVSVKPHVATLSVISTADPAAPAAIHFDVFAGINYLGVPLLTPGLLESESELNRAGVAILSQRGRALATTVHHVCWSGALAKEKYRQELDEVLARPEDGAWVTAALRESMGGPAARVVLAAHARAGLGSGGLQRRLTVSFLVLAAQLRRHPSRTLRGLARYVASQVPTFLRPAGVAGHRGDALPGLEAVELSLELACTLSPHSFAAASVRARASEVRTANSELYEQSLRRRWRRSTPIRTVAPSLFVWLEVKRGRIVLLDRLPFALRLLARSRWKPGWIAGGRSPRAQGRGRPAAEEGEGRSSAGDR